MNKYKEALDDIKDIYTNKDDRLVGEVFEKQVLILQELVDKEIELESRKDKMIVGSEWICEVDCSGTLNTWGAGDVGKIISVNHRIVEVVDAQFDEQDFFTTAEFPRLFKPKG